MRRREFIAALGGAAIWPVAASSQQGERERRIGIRFGGNENDQEFRLRFEAFRQELQRLGWIEGRNLRIDIQWGAGSSEIEQARREVRELLALEPDAVLAGGGEVCPLGHCNRPPVLFRLCLSVS